MASIRPRFKDGPITYDVVEAVAGGQLIEARTGGKVGVAGAASAKVLGVAEYDAAPGTDNDEATGDPLNIAALGKPHRTVVGVGWYVVTYSANASFGDRLAATATGQVAPASTNPVIGYCAEPAGVTAGGKGLTRILV